MRTTLGAHKNTERTVHPFTAQPHFLPATTVTRRRAAPTGGGKNDAVVHATVAMRGNYGMGRPSGFTAPFQLAQLRTREMQDVLRFISAVGMRHGLTHEQVCDPAFLEKCINVANTHIGPQVLQAVSTSLASAWLNGRGLTDREIEGLQLAMARATMMTKPPSHRWQLGGDQDDQDTQIIMVAMGGILTLVGGTIACAAALAAGLVVAVTTTVLIPLMFVAAAVPVLASLPIVRVIEQYTPGYKSDQDLLRLNALSLRGDQAAARELTEYYLPSDGVKQTVAKIVSTGLMPAAWILSKLLDDKKPMESLNNFFSWGKKQRDTNRRANTIQRGILSHRPPQAPQTRQPSPPSLQSQRSPPAPQTRQPSQPSLPSLSSLQSQRSPPAPHTPQPSLPSLPSLQSQRSLPSQRSPLAPHIPQTFLQSQSQRSILPGIHSTRTQQRPQVRGVSELPLIKRRTRAAPVSELPPIKPRTRAVGRNAENRRQDRKSGPRRTGAAQATGKHT